jgi:hypothetical protein
MSPRLVTYKKPRRINSVSVIVFAFLALSIYVGYALWPVALLRLGVKEEIRTSLPALWRANLRMTSIRLEEGRIRRDLMERLRILGVQGMPEILMERTKELVSIQVNFTTEAFFPGINRTMEFAFSPRAETSSERVEW